MTVRRVGITTITSAQVESDRARVASAEISGGELVGSRPNRLASARARATAGGGVEVDLVYVARGQEAAASTVQIAQVTRKVPDWGSPLASPAIGSKVSAVTVSVGTFAHEQTVRLAARAVTAAGVAGPILRLAPVVALTTGPSAVDYLEGEQI